MADDAIGCVNCRQRVIHCRGNCSVCYNRHQKAVKAGRTTWAELEAAGQARPPTDAAARRAHLQRLGQWLFESG
jgi:hypothetical protein